jgi:hypothetical protein
MVHELVYDQQKRNIAQKNNHINNNNIKSDNGQ